MAALKLEERHDPYGCWQHEVISEVPLGEYPARRSFF